MKDLSCVEARVRGGFIVVFNCPGKVKISDSTVTINLVYKDVLRFNGGSRRFKMEIRSVR